MFPEQMRDLFVDAWAERALTRWDTTTEDARLAATDHLARIEAEFTLKEFIDTEFEMLCGQTTDMTQRWLGITGAWMTAVMPNISDIEVAQHLKGIQDEMTRIGRSGAEIWIAISDNAAQYIKWVERTHLVNPIKYAREIAGVIQEGRDMQLPFLVASSKFMQFANQLVCSWLIYETSPSAAMTVATVEAQFHTSDSYYGMILAQAHGL